MFTYKKNYVTLQKLIVHYSKDQWRVADNISARFAVAEPPNREWGNVTALWIINHVVGCILLYRVPNRFVEKIETFISQQFLFAVWAQSRQQREYNAQFICFRRLVGTVAITVAFQEKILCSNFIGVRVFLFDVLDMGCNHYCLVCYDSST